MERAIAIASIVCTIRAEDTRKFEARICSCDWDFDQTYMDRKRWRVMITAMIAYEDVFGIKLNGVFASLEDRTICTGAPYLRS